MAATLAARAESGRTPHRAARATAERLRAAAEGLAAETAAAWIARSRREQRRPRPKTKPARWADALAEVRALQAECQAWRDHLPDSLADSRTAELLEEICDIDLDALDVELLRGFGRD